MTILGERSLVECDGCGLVTDLPVADENWVVLAYAAGEFRPPLDFCSEECLERRLKEQRIFNE